MSNERSTRDRGNLFENTDKKKPSQPDFQGDCTIDNVAYEILGWRRGEQMTVTLAPPRGDRNTYPPDVFRGAFDAAPPKPVRPAAKGGKAGKAAAAAAAAAAPVIDPDAVAVPAWSGDIVSDDHAYTVRAFEKQGKSGMYFTLSFERIDRLEHLARLEQAAALVEHAD